MPPTGPPTHLHTELLRQEVITAAVECQVMQGNMAKDQAVPPVGIMGVTGDSIPEDPMAIMLLQVTSLLALTQRRTSGSRLSTQTAAASST